MRILVTIISVLALVACAQVPYDAEGRVIVPQTANFAVQASEGKLDRALDELVVKINPGAEEFRAVAATTLAVLIFCEINDCRKSRGRRSTARTSAAVAIDSSTSTKFEGQVSGLESLERTQLQVQELSVLATAFAEIAERDSKALLVSNATDQASSWVGLYETRLATLVAAREPVEKSRQQLEAFTKRTQKTTLGRALAPNIVEVKTLSDQSVERLNTSIRRLEAAITAMKAAI